jgi:hypothetical protein
VVFLAYSLTRFLTDAAGGLLRADEVALLTLYKSIIALEVLLPLALYFGLIVGFSRLNSHAELTAHAGLRLRAAAPATAAVPVQPAARHRGRRIFVHGQAVGLLCDVRTEGASRRVVPNSIASRPSASTSTTPTTARSTSSTSAVTGARCPACSFENGAAKAWW